MTYKKILLLSFASLGFNINAYASTLSDNDLTTINCTKFPSTTITNKGVCSDILGDVGVTPPDCKPHIVEASKVKFACFANKHNCSADVYMTNHCNKGGESKIATVKFDIDTGIKSIVMDDPSYSITGEGFRVSINGGP